MAGKLKDDQIRWVLSLDAKGVQGELVKVSSVISRLKQENKELEKEMKAAGKAMNDAERAMNRMEDAGKTNTKQYERAKISYQQNAAALVELKGKIEQNNKAIGEENKK
jgi:phage-related tail protein